jgi:hypothetical protein
MRVDAVILLGANGAPVVQRVGLLDHVRARLRARALDRALAAGESSETAPAVALRARRLTELSTRRQLARSLRAMVLRAREGTACAWKVPVARHRVLAAMSELTRLANLLLTPGPVDPSGVAQVQLLVTDGTGPLYNPAAEEDLATAAERAIQALRV